MGPIEPAARRFCAESLDPLVGTGRSDFIADLAAEMPMKAIGMLLGIPAEDQAEIRDRIDASMRLDEEGNHPKDEGPGMGASMAAASPITSTGAPSTPPTT